MTKSHLSFNTDDHISLNVSLPEDMIRDLVLRSEENGRDIHVEIMMRLARALDRDVKMEQEDSRLLTQYLWQPKVI
jgi:hypothetical protein